MSRIEQIINEMEEYLDGCKAQAFSNSKRIVVEKDVMDDMLVELRMRTPEAAASSSDKGSTFKRQRSKLKTMIPARMGGAPYSKDLYPAASRLPISQ